MASSPAPAPDQSKSTMASKRLVPRTLKTEATIKTASWFTPLPSGHVRINITRGVVPRHLNLQSSILYRALAPSCSQTYTPPADFQRNFLARLGALDPEFVYHDLIKLAAPQIPVLCCWEDPQQIHAGVCGCHRHIVAQCWSARWISNARKSHTQASTASDIGRCIQLQRPHPPTGQEPKQ